MGNIITPVLPHDLPENWNDNQYVSPGGTEVGLTEKHGYNYLMKQVNNSQKAINELDAEMGDIDIALQNKAPDGYGLGKNIGMYITDGNEAVYGGNYYWGNTTQNLPFSYGCMGVTVRSDGSLIQTAYSEGYSGCSAQRKCDDGTFGEWEWVNPPFIKDVVYRTTERHLGNPVYKKMDSNGVIWWSTDQSTWKCEAERVGAYSKTESDALLQKKAPIYQSNVSYPADAQVVWKGNVWKNTSGQSVTGVEPGTNYNIWNVGYSNPNLLDNPWFTVNQRGKNKYTGAGYSFDRWYLWGGSTLTKNSDGSITLSARDWRNLIQIFELDLFNRLVGKTVTASVLLGDGTVSSRTIVFTDPGNSYNQFSLYPNPFSGKVFCINIYGPSNTNIANKPYFNLYTNVDVTVKAMKLELGSVSTLANDAPPNYATELAKCQRYFQIIPIYGAIGVNAWGSSVELYYWMPTTMRTIPSATFPSDLSNAIREMASRNLTPDDMSLDGSSFLSNEKITIVVRSSNMSTGKVYGNGIIIPLTADL